MFQERSIRAAAMAAVTLLVGACGDDPSSPGSDRQTIGDYVAAISADGTPGTMLDNTLPRPTSGGPTASVEGNRTIVNGGATTVTVTSPTPFQTVYVGGSIPASRLFVAVDGCFEIPLPAPVTSAELLITFPQTLAGNTFDLVFSTADSSGLVGLPAQKSYRALIVGTGDVQVTVAWDTDADVDLHVVDPSGSEIYWAARQSPSGGRLDLDSNPACVLDDVRNENITWPVGTAPQGTYTVRVDYWSSCDVPETRFTVLIHNEGTNELFEGRFEGPGDQGGYGSGVQIATFTRTTGPLAPAPSPSSQNLPVGPTTKPVTP
jgi:hypothetical protein